MFAEQYYVNLPVKPVVDRSDFAIWCIPRNELYDVVIDLEAKRGDWELVSSSDKLAQPNKHHPTAIARRRAPAPLRYWVSKYKPLSDGIDRLYHGCGRDYPGMTMLRRGGCRVTGYDPFHPNPKFRKQPPEFTFREVFSIYTLNVMSKVNGIDLLLEFRDVLKTVGNAIIAVRRDLV